MADSRSTADENIDQVGIISAGMTQLRNEMSKTSYRPYVRLYQDDSQDGIESEATVRLLDDRDLIMHRTDEEVRSAPLRRTATATSEAPKGHLPGNAMDSFTSLLQSQASAVNELAKSMTTMQQEIKDLKRSSSKTRKTGSGQRKRGSENETDASNAKKSKPTIISDSDSSESEHESDSDGFSGLNNLMEGGKADNDSSEEEEMTALKELSDFLGDEEKTGNDLSPELATIVDKLFKGKSNPEKVKELTGKYDRPKNVVSLSAPRVNKEIWDTMPAKAHISDVKLQTTQNLVGKAMIPTLRLFDMFLTSKKAANIDVKMAKHYCGDILKFLRCVFHNISFKRREMIIQPDRNKNFVSLCSAESSSENLFGDDLGTQVKNVLETRKLAQKISGQIGTGKFRIPKKGNGNKKSFKQGKGDFLEKSRGKTKKKKFSSKSQD